VDVEEDTVTVRATCSPGFYVRALAVDLGLRLGTGAHLTALRRVRSGDLSIEQALPFAVLCDPREGAERARQAILPLATVLGAMPAVRLTAAGVHRVVHGRDVSPVEAQTWLTPSERGRTADSHVRLIGPDGALVAVAEPSETPGFLHPAVVLV
jgi:tRNA pseudouridine55 synthase